MDKKQIITGFIFGLIANAVGLFFAASIIGEMGRDGGDFLDVIKSAQSQGFLGKLISMGAILNIVAFFIFIKKRQDFKARGVLLATVLIALLTLVFKLF